MPKHAPDCPFLNQADSRCGENLCLDALGHAFDYCFGYYEGCALYQELLAERRTNQALGLALQPEFEEVEDEFPAGATRVVQVTIAGRVRQGASDRAGVPDALGV